MASLAEIREGLRARLATIEGLRAHAYWPKSISHPAAVVDLDNRTPHIRSGNGSLTRWRITVLAGPASIVTDEGQATRDEYLAASGDRSVQAALEGEKSLGGVASSLVVTSVDNGPILEWPPGTGAYYWGGSVDCEIRD